MKRFAQVVIVSAALLTAASVPGVAFAAGPESAPIAQAAQETVPSSQVGTAAISPWVSPSVYSEYSADPSCPLGYFCTWVSDPTTSSWKKFYFYNCGYYALYYWNGNGYARNNQTGGVIARVYDENTYQIAYYRADNTQHIAAWDPAYEIKPC